MDADTIADMLELLATDEDAKKKGRQFQTLRGIRGVSDGEVARIASAMWNDDPPRWPDDARELTKTFLAAHEDGLVAIGLLGALVMDDPSGVFDLGVDWLGRTDDVATADALGIAVLGPAALASNRVPELIAAGKGCGRPAGRRAVVVAALAAIPAPLSGPALAALRERIGSRSIQIVDTLVEAVPARIIEAFVRDPSPEVHKGLRRVLRQWAQVDKEGARAFIDRVPGGVPKTLRAELGEKTKPRRRR